VSARARRGAAAVVLAAAAPLALPAAASAHGLQGKTDLPLPTWLFSWAAAIVLVVSFAALAALWPKPQLQDERRRRIGRLPEWLDVPAGAIGIAFFAIVVYAGFAGTQANAQANLATVFVYVHFWVGLAFVSVLFGNVFRSFNPWLAAARAAGWAYARLRGGRAWSPPLAYPSWLGYWPTVAGIVAFAWVELCYQDKTHPEIIAGLIVAYAVTQLAAMAAFGAETWSRRGDPFGTYFGVLSRLSIWAREDGVLYVRPPLSGAPQLPLLPGVVALLTASIGSTSFDGFSNGSLWADVSPDLTDFFSNLGAGPQTAVQWASTLGLAVAILVVSGFYWLGIRGMQTVGRGHTARELAGKFAHTLIPIAFAYAVAHYFSLLAFQGQAAGYLLSDPLGTGSNLFGTAKNTIDYNLVSSNTVWYVQVGALVAGHVCGLILAHDRAIALYPKPREAIRSQYWMLVVMVGFTSLGLWLLSAVRT
jgi:hypothetical protein